MNATPQAPGPNARHGDLSADRQKARVLTFFCVLGMSGFLINLLAGVALWMNDRAGDNTAPTYDAFVAEVARRGPDGMKSLATDMYERWAECATAGAGWSQVTTHALITASVLGAALFAVCAALAYQLYGRLNALQRTWAPPQPPDPLEDDGHVR